MQRQISVNGTSGKNGCQSQTSVVKAAKIITKNPSMSGCYIRAVDNSVSVAVRDITTRVESKSAGK